jgi:hypothetical protein
MTLAVSSVTEVAVSHHDPQASWVSSKSPKKYPLPDHTHENTHAHPATRPAAASAPPTTSQSRGERRHGGEWSIPLELADARATRRRVVLVVIGGRVLRRVRLLVVVRVGLRMATAPLLVGLGRLHEIRVVRWARQGGVGSADHERPRRLGLGSEGRHELGGTSLRRASDCRPFGSLPQLCPISLIVHYVSPAFTL